MTSSVSTRRTGDPVRRLSSICPMLILTPRNRSQPAARQRRQCPFPTPSSRPERPFSGLMTLTQTDPTQTLLTECF